MSSNTPTKTSEEKQGKDNKVQSVPFWRKHFLKLFLIVLIIASIAWGWISNIQLEKSHKKEITELKENHAEKLLTLTKRKNKEISQTLALAVRSELIDENQDQVNQYFLQVLKQPGVEKLMLVDHNTGKVLISTNKKDEGIKFQDDKLLSAKDVVTLKKDGKWYTSSPIMGLNSQLALIIMVTGKE